MPEPVTQTEATAVDTVAVKKSLPVGNRPPATTSMDPEAVIGFGGAVMGGLKQHPGPGKAWIYSLGATVVISDAKYPTRRQHFLHGHSDAVTALAVSRTGRYIASGQKTHRGFQADVIVWDFETRRQVHKFSLHKVSVQALAFSHDEKFLVTLGGADDNYLAVWDVERGTAVAGAAAAKDTSAQPTLVQFMHTVNNKFVTAGAGPIRIWEFDAVAKKITCVECQLGQIKRVVLSLAIADEGKEGAGVQWAYCGTTTGDILRINLGNGLLSTYGPPKPKHNLSLGVTALALSPRKKDLMFVGSGDGTLAKCDLATLSFTSFVKLNGMVTSLVFGESGALFAATAVGNIYKLLSVDLKQQSPEIIATAHHTRVNDVAFPDECSDIFATASDHDVRVWNAASRKELLQIAVQNVQCLAVSFKRDGTSILTGWSDGKIRAFKPESGTQQYEINDAHRNGVTCMCSSKPHAGEFRIISGGVDGQVRVWKISKQSQILERSMKEHKETVSCIKLKSNEKECISTSQDGSCIVWDLTRGTRLQVMFAATFFKSCAYYPDESQLVTCGTDRKVSYWEVFDGTLIRELQVADHDSVNAIALTQDGKHFVVGADKLVKVLRYEQGDVVFTGKGHSAEITQLRISPNQKHIVSVSVDGAVFVWTMPK